MYHLWYVYSLTPFVSVVEVARADSLGVPWIYVATTTLTRNAHRHHQLRATLLEASLLATEP